MRTTLATAALLVVTAAAPATADEPDPVQTLPSVALTAWSRTVALPAVPAGSAISPAILPLPPRTCDDRRDHLHDDARGQSRTPLVPLYVSFATLQVLDIWSTTRALGAGHREANPMMRPLADHPVAMAAVKTAATCVTVWAAEKLSKRSRRTAVAFMVGANAALATIVWHNYRVEQR